jgi:hypothetical protein
MKKRENNGERKEDGGKGRVRGIKEGTLSRQSTSIYAGVGGFQRCTLK